MMRVRSKRINLNQVLHKPSLLLVLGTILLVTGCTTGAATRQTFAEIISHTSSNTSPNWRGIEPGKTTEAEFRKIVSTDPDIFDDLRRFQRRPEGTRYIWYDTEFKFPIGASFHENIVSYLDLSVPGSFSFENILNIAGTPTAYMAGPTTPEIMSIELLYEEKGVVITFYVEVNPSKMVGVRRNCKFAITEDTPVNNIDIYFVEQNNLDSMITTLTTDVFTVPGEIPEPWIGIEDALRLTGGRTYLEDKTLIDCSNQ